MIHRSITAKRVEAACDRRLRSLANPGFCANCGKGADCCEPDAREYECESCGEHAVYGAEEFLFGAVA